MRITNNLAAGGANAAEPSPFFRPCLLVVTVALFIMSAESSTASKCFNFDVTVEPSTPTCEDVTSEELMEMMKIGEESWYVFDFECSYLTDLDRENSFCCAGVAPIIYFGCPSSCCLCDASTAPAMSVLVRRVDDVDAEVKRISGPSIAADAAAATSSRICLDYGCYAAESDGGFSADQELRPLLPLDHLESLESLDLSGNSLTGEFFSLDTLSALQFLDLRQNSLAGSIPQFCLGDGAVCDLTRNRYVCGVDEQIGPSSCVPIDIGALATLRAIYQATDGPNWRTYLSQFHLFGWDDENRRDYCSWYGVTCHADGSVASIDLSDVGLAGQIPPLDHLQSLESLDLSFNKGDTSAGITGELPPLDDLPLLKYLNMASNSLHGIPTLCLVEGVVCDFTNNPGICGADRQIGPAGSCVPIDLGTAETLHAFYLATDGSEWINGEGWEENDRLDYCSWYGVKCNHDGSVTHIDLSSNGLSGPVRQLVDVHHPEVRVSFRITTSEGGELVAFSDGLNSLSDAQFCVSDCPIDEPYNAATSGCAPCPKGKFTASSAGRTWGVCRDCPVGTFSSNIKSRDCSPCPAHLPLSAHGSQSESECFALSSNIHYLNDYTTSVMRFDPNDELFSELFSPITSNVNFGGVHQLGFLSPNLVLLGTDTYTIDVLDGNGEHIGPFLTFPDDCESFGCPAGNSILVSAERDRLIIVTMTSDSAFIRVYSTKEWIHDYVREENGSWTKPSVQLAPYDKPLLSVPLPSNLVNNNCLWGNFDLLFGQTEGEILLVDIGFDDGSPCGSVSRICLSDTCRNEGKEGTILSAMSTESVWSALTGIAVIPDEGIYFVGAKRRSFPTSVSYFKCDLLAPVNPRSSLDSCDALDTMSWCGGFPPVFGIAVDPEKEVMYWLDVSNDWSLKEVSFSGQLLGHVSHIPEGSDGEVRSLSVRPGFFSPLSSFEVKGNVKTSVRSEVSLITAGTVGLSVTLKYSSNAPIRDADAVPSEFILVRAYLLSDDPDGEPLVVFGAHVPTPSSPAAEQQYSLKLITKAGEWSISVTEERANVAVHFLASPRTLTVVPAETDATKCQATVTSAVSEKVPFKVSLFSFDSYDNPTDGEDDEFVGWFIGKSARTTGSSARMPLHRVVDQASGLATFELTRRTAEFKNKGNYAFHLVHVSSGVEVNGSPFSINVNVIDVEAIGIGLGVAAVCIFLAAYLFRRYKSKTTTRIYQLAQEKGIFQEAKLAAEREAHEYQSENIRQSFQVKKLQEELEKTKHTEEELRVMKESLDSLSKTSSNELRGVLVSSADVTILSMLGKGGFGVVHLGDFKGEKVAVKQLITIDQESILRFRFECFLMKNLRHPNIVRLVGVCWDELMLACLLEFVSNGSLQDHLKSDRSKAAHEKMTWKNRLLRVALQTALAVQYLHQSRYYDEKIDSWKDCIIHRDLKPDNILVAGEPEFTVKLSDFGEARATETNYAMTTVGTPIFMAPEVLRNDNYDFKVDVYSYSVVLVAMLRCENDVVKYFFEALRRHMKKKDTKGIGIQILNNRMMNQNFRPHLPQQLYPSLKKLIEECWSNSPDERPTFDAIVSRLGGEIAVEVNAFPEPDVSWDAVALPDRETVVDHQQFEGAAVRSVFQESDDIMALKKTIEDLKIQESEERSKRRSVEIERDVLLATHRNKGEGGFESSEIVGRLESRLREQQERNAELENALSKFETETRREQSKVAELEEALRQYQQQTIRSNSTVVAAGERGRESLSTSRSTNGTDEAALAATERVFKM